jgi:predicted dehydrogenase
MDDKMRVGIIGVGNISPAYIEGCRRFDVLEVTACADLDETRARKIAADYAIPRALSVNDLLRDPDIDIVINLTVPDAHADVSVRALQAGKHVYSEKPLATTLEDGRRILDAAEAAGRRVGCAPDTFLFAPHQTARKLVDDGLIGKPIAAVGFFASHGPESWHPNPDFFYAPGAGPMFDMGPYYVTCLVNLLGAVVRVSGTAHAALPHRTANDGRAIPVGVPTHYAGTLEFASGAVATLITSFDVWGHHLPTMELYGEKGTLTLPDPNGYEPREVRAYIPGEYDWEAMPFVHADKWKRGIGVADMAYAILESRPHRASGELAFHVLEVMTALETAMHRGAYVQIERQPMQPAPMPVNFGEHEADVAV